jgi:hypothetical protein
MAILFLHYYQLTLCKHTKKTAKCKDIKTFFVHLQQTINPDNHERKEKRHEPTAIHQAHRHRNAFRYGDDDL